jgi:hypothetical protein
MPAAIRRRPPACSSRTARSGGDEAPVYVDLVRSMGSKLLEFGPRYRVKPVPDFFAEVKALLGEAAVT